MITRSDVPLAYSPLDAQNKRNAGLDDNRGLRCKIESGLMELEKEWRVRTIGDPVTLAHLFLFIKKKK